MVNDWLVVWNIFFPFSWEFHHPNISEVHDFSEGLVETTNHMLFFRYPLVNIQKNYGKHT
jgi:hypothetical protein